MINTQRWHTPGYVILSRVLVYFVQQHHGEALTKDIRDALNILIDAAKRIRKESEAN